MAHKDWLEMPTVGSGTPEDSLRPKYPIAGNAVLVYRGDKVYIAMEDGSARTEVAKQPEIRHLTPGEALQLEDSLPFPLVSFSRHDLVNNMEGVGLGDVVAWVTHKLGFTECPGCQRRRKWLNRVVVWGWWHK